MANRGTVRTSSRRALANSRLRIFPRSVVVSIWLPVRVVCWTFTPSIRRKRGASPSFIAEYFPFHASIAPNRSRHASRALTLMGSSSPAFRR